MNNKNNVRTYEFKSVGEEPAVDIQIDEWLQKYSQVAIVDVKYQVVPYVENETLNFATFALVLYEEMDDGSEINKAATQQMKYPPSFARRHGK